MSRRSDRDSGRPLALVVALLAGLLISCLAACGPAPSTRMDPARNRLPLDAWVDFVQAEPGSVRPRVQVSTPYRSLVFHRSDHRFHSGLEVRVVAIRDGEQVGGGVGTARVDLATSEETRATTLMEAAAPIHVRGERPVILAVTVSVLESSRSWYRELEYVPRTLNAMPIWIVAVSPGESVYRDGDHLVFGDADTLSLAVTLQQRANVPVWPPDAIELATEIDADPLPEPLRQTRPVRSGSSPGAELVIEEHWAVADLPFGRCRVRTALETEVDGERLSLPREPALKLINLRVPLADDDAWERHLDWLEGYLAESARDSLAALPADDRDEAWQALWRAPSVNRGQAPAVAQRTHLLRIVAADDRFGGYRRGALSDRGKALIRRGEPSRIETYPDAHTPGAVWEAWEYPELGLRLLFFDAHGMGDYRQRGEEPLDS